MHPYLRRHVVCGRVCQHSGEIHQSRISHGNGKGLDGDSTGIQALRLLVGVDASSGSISDLHFHLNRIYWVQQTAANMNLYTSNATVIELDSSGSLLRRAMRFHEGSRLELELHTAFPELIRSLSITQGTSEHNPNYRDKRQC